MSTLAEAPVRNAYLDLLQRALTNYQYLGAGQSFDEFRAVTHYDLGQSQWKVDPLSRPLTLLTRGQLDLVGQAILDIEARKVRGDLIEAGIWRGGCVAYMRAVLEAHAIPQRRVFAADSFCGIPMNTRAVNDPVDAWTDRWVATLPEVRDNLARFGLLDERVRFVAGFFEESLKTLANERFALIRLDSDSYDSVETSLIRLYPLVSPGGVIIIDDWHLAGCRQAVLEYRARHGIRDAIQEYEANAYWVKQKNHVIPGLG